jgi:hypothetical protein
VNEECVCYVTALLEMQYLFFMTDNFPFSCASDISQDFKIAVLAAQESHSAEISHCILYLDYRESFPFTFFFNSCCWWDDWDNRNARNICGPIVGQGCKFCDNLILLLEIFQEKRHLCSWEHPTDYITPILLSKQL